MMNGMDGMIMWRKATKRNFYVDQYNNNKNLDDKISPLEKNIFGMIMAGRQATKCNFYVDQGHDRTEFRMWGSDLMMANAAPPESKITNFGDDLSMF